MNQTFTEAEIVRAVMGFHAGCVEGKTEFLADLGVETNFTVTATLCVNVPRWDDNGEVNDPKTVAQMVRECLDDQLHHFLSTSEGTTDVSVTNARDSAVAAIGAA